MPSIAITQLGTCPNTLAMLTDLLIETVAHGGSVSFMHPLAADEARGFWAGSLEAAGRGERVIFGAWDGPLLVGTVTLLLDLPPNQPHRAEIAKMMTRVSHRGRRVATHLMRAAEAHAAGLGRSLLVLDTAEEDGAAPFYERLGYTLAGRIPDFALKPLGGLTATKLYYKRINPVAA